MLYLILSVSRNPHILKERNARLIASGYSVASAYSKEEAMEKLLEGDFDLILICPSLGKDGCQLAKTARRHRPSIPIVSIAPNPGPMQDYGAQLAGSGLDEIAAAVHEVLGNAHSRFAARRFANAVPRFPRPTTKTGPQFSQPRPESNLKAG
jgi:DNA-binding NarL/FixJ family response regulator